jgi:hypothetical protein
MKTERLLAFGQNHLLQSTYSTEYELIHSISMPIAASTMRNMASFAPKRTQSRPMNASAVLIVILALLSWGPSDAHPRARSRGERFRTHATDSLRQHGLPELNNTLNGTLLESPDDYGDENVTEYAKPHHNATKKCGCKEGSGSTKGGKGSTCTPSSHPSSAPIVPSEIPTSEPTNTFSIEPSVSVSEAPSLVPTVSEAPALSSQPTPEQFEAGAESTPNGTYWETTCGGDPPVGSASFQEQRLVFLYHLYVPDDSHGESVMETVDVMEGRIHNGLAQHFLSCTASSEEDPTVRFDIVSVTSSPPDIALFDDQCVREESLMPSPVPPNSTCVVVVADLGMIAFIPPTTRRRHLRRYGRVLASVTEANPQVLEASGEYLDDAMADGDFDGGDVLRVIFRGFVLPGAGDGGVEGGGVPPIVAGANDELQTGKQDSNVSAGATAVAFAIICLIVVVGMALHRRKSRHDVYVRHLNEMESVTGDKEYDIDDRTTEIVANDSFDWTVQHYHDEDGRGALMTSEAGGLHYQHDVHKCTSAYCEACRSHEKAHTRFVRSSLGPEAILTDLRYAPCIAESENQRPYTSPDTTDL